MRQFLAPCNPDRNGLLDITGKDYRYLRQVLRLKTGDMLSVRMPSGILQNMTVCSINVPGRAITLQVCASPGSSENITRGVKAGEIAGGAENIEYWLFQFIAKPQKMEQIIRQAVECGVKYIVPVIGVYSQKSNIAAMQSARKERIGRIIREARQQSGSPVESVVMPSVSPEDSIKLWKEAAAGEENENAAVVLWERSEKTKPVHEILSGRKIKKAAVAAGCEGGISPEEIELFTAGTFVPVHFAVNILRCETAALYGIAALQSALLENDIWEYKE